MKREVVQDFLNLPGIAGLALIDGRSRPYFCGIDRSLNFQQKEALAQGIQQVIDTTPSGFEFFEFQFSGHQVYIYRLEHGIILLVLALDSLVVPNYVDAVEQLKIELQNDVANAIATFRLLAGSTTLSGQNYWRQGAGTTPDPTASTSNSPTSNSPTSASTASSRTPTSGAQSTSIHTNNGFQRPGLRAMPTAGLPVAQPTSSPSAGPLPASSQGGFSSTSGEPATMREVLAAMNYLSKYATQYLGPMVVANYWKTSRPNADWLNQFQVERSAQINCVETSSTLSAEQHQWVREWVVAFIERCSKVIRDFPKSVRHTALDDRQKFLLLPDSH